MFPVVIFELFALNKDFYILADRMAIPTDGIRELS